MRHIEKQSDIGPETTGGDEYKVKQLQKMLTHETSGGEAHYGAHLSHWYGDAAPLTLDAGGLKALIQHYQSHDTDMGNAGE